MENMFSSKTRPSTGNEDQSTLQRLQHFAANKRSHRAGKEVQWKGKKAGPETALRGWNRNPNPTLENYKKRHFVLN